MNYREQTGREPDFRVQYSWLSPIPGGFNQQPYQHMRCDFSYAGDDLAITGIYMIFPEFEDPHGVPIPEGARIPLSGTATMWILDDTLRSTIHAERIQRGTECYFMVGAHQIAKALVIERLGLGAELRPSCISRREPGDPNGAA